ncbi:uncharacterized protein LOC126746336 [Anthonomus grandis grandis]|uniref:uncharacterized protein LOC126746336 n=1 Tax=Anthonomus grandis grandis TaxID=2921223 RepID=UPI0021652B85|nr:uncharacterized protein LOC126746336 [Anthonomus grandis grandis]XP_050310509.1 uncharacterized protein LOC126746336 [Anthonomus grandis grandis]
MGTQEDYVRSFYEGLDREKSSNESLARALENESQDVTKVIIFVTSAVLVIILIFVMAIFIDCRQQKLESMMTKAARKQKKPVRRKFPALPAITEGALRDDRTVIIEHMEEEPVPTSSSSHNIV